MRSLRHLCCEGRRVLQDRLTYPERGDDLADYFKEIGPSYRQLDSSGHAAWLELEHKAKIGEMKGQGYAKKGYLDHLAAWKLQCWW
ncbi:hypothetical protein [Mesorhizobium sp.]|uniref:hypothetical protein n=1 Tax=Mesorhizobium sp. TaxID=1871066 RepID=UPI002DDD6837|nr:hypothetical protein [Mesorhizobium sp.]